jgi:hypothetical protein
VSEAAELAHDERRALALGQVLEVGAKLSKAFADLDGLGQRISGQRVEDVQLDGDATLAQARDRLVMGDAEQPRAHLEIAFLEPQRRVRLGHRALQRVARLLVVAEERAAIAIQRTMVALVHRRERRSAAARGL